MRQVVGALTGIFLSLYFLYFFIPMASTEHTQFNQLVNATDPVIATSYTLGSGFYMILPLICLLVAGFVIINYALKRDAGE